MDSEDVPVDGAVDKKIAFGQLRQSVSARLCDLLDSAGIYATRIVSGRRFVRWEVVPGLLVERNAYISGLPWAFFFNKTSPATDVNQLHAHPLNLNILSWKKHTIEDILQRVEDGRIRVLERPQGRDVVFELITPEGNTVDIGKWPDSTNIQSSAGVLRPNRSSKPPRSARLPGVKPPSSASGSTNPPTTPNSNYFNQPQSVLGADGGLESVMDGENSESGQHTGGEGGGFAGGGGGGGDDPSIPASGSSASGPHGAGMNVKEEMVDMLIQPTKVPPPGKKWSRRSSPDRVFMNHAFNDLLRKAGMVIPRQKDDSSRLPWSSIPQFLAQNRFYISNFPECNMPWVYSDPSTAAHAPNAVPTTTNSDSHPLLPHRGPAKDWKDRIDWKSSPSQRAYKTLAMAFRNGDIQILPRPPGRDVIFEVKDAEGRLYDSTLGFSDEWKMKYMYSQGPPPPPGNSAVSTTAAPAAAPAVASTSYATGYGRGGGPSMRGGVDMEMDELDADGEEVDDDRLHGSTSQISPIYLKPAYNDYQSYSGSSSTSALTQRSSGYPNRGRSPVPVMLGSPSRSSTGTGDRDRDRDRRHLFPPITSSSSSSTHSQSHPPLSSSASSSSLHAPTDNSLARYRLSTERRRVNSDDSGSTTTFQYGSYGSYGGSRPGSSGHGRFATVDEEEHVGHGRDSHHYHHRQQQQHQQHQQRKEDRPMLPPLDLSRDEWQIQRDKQEVGHSKGLILPPIKLGPPSHTSSSSNTHRHDSMEGVVNTGGSSATTTTSSSEPIPIGGDGGGFRRRPSDHSRSPEDVYDYPSSAQYVGSRQGMSRAVASGSGTSGGGYEQRYSYPPSASSSTAMFTTGSSGGGHTSTSMSTATPTSHSGNTPYFGGGSTTMTPAGSNPLLSRGSADGRLRHTGSASPILQHSLGGHRHSHGHHGHGHGYGGSSFGYSSSQLRSTASPLQNPIAPEPPSSRPSSSSANSSSVVAASAVRSAGITPNPTHTPNITVAASAGGGGTSPGSSSSEHTAAATAAAPIPYWSSSEKVWKLTITKELLVSLPPVLSPDIHWDTSRAVWVLNSRERGRERERERTTSLPTTQSQSGSPAASSSKVQEGQDVADGELEDKKPTTTTTTSEAMEEDVVGEMDEDEETVDSMPKGVSAYWSVTQNAWVLDFPRS